MGEWINVDLSTAVFMTFEGDTYGQYTGGVIDSLDGNTPSFHFPGVTFDNATTYEVEITWTTAGPDNLFYMSRYLDHSEDEWAFGTAYDVVFNEFVDEAVHTWTIGPGVGSWDAAVAAGYDAFVWNTGLVSAISAIRYRSTSDAEPEPEAFPSTKLASRSAFAT